MPRNATEPTNNAANMAYPPIDPESLDFHRVEHARLRRRFLEGNWDQDGATFIREEIEDTRADAWGRPDFGRCLAKDIWNQSSALYRDYPAISHVLTAEAMEAATLVEKAKEAKKAGTLADFLANLSMVDRFRYLIEDMGKWTPTMDAFQPYVVGLREGGMRVDVVGRKGRRRLQFTPIAADLMEVWVDPDQPDEPLMVKVYRLRRGPKDEGGKAIWTADVWDVSDPENPTFKVEEVSDSKGNPVKVPRDMSASYMATKDNPMGQLGGKNYPWRYPDQENRPFIPVQIYHARIGLGRVWDSLYGREIVDGTLADCCFRTFWRHCFRDASWPQKNVADLKPAGTVATDKRPGQAYVTTDPSSVMVWKSTGTMAGQFHQFAPGADPTELLNAVENHAAGVVSSYGISPSDVMRVAADPRSGYAIALSKDGIRKEIARYTVHFAACDGPLLGMAAALWTLFGDGALAGEYPSEGWNVTHRGLPMSAEEEKTEGDRQDRRVELGTSSPVDVYMETRGVTRPEAKQAVIRVIREKLELEKAEAEIRKELGLTAPTGQLPGKGGGENEQPPKDANKPPDPDDPKAEEGPPGPGDGDNKQPPKK